MDPEGEVPLNHKLCDAGPGPDRGPGTGASRHGAARRTLSAAAAATAAAGRVVPRVILGDGASGLSGALWQRCARARGDTARAQATAGGADSVISYELERRLDRGPRLQCVEPP
jgi:hypothetical protein